MTGYARSRQALATAVGLAAAMIITITAHSTSLRLFFDPQSSTVRLGLLTPVLSALAVHLSMGLPLGEMEAVFARELRRLRALHVLAITLCLASGAAAYAAIHGPGGAVGQSVRNTALLVGLLLGTAVVLGSEPAWVVPVGLVLATYGFGISSDEGTPRGWAWLLHDASRGGLLAATGVLALAAGLFIARGPRGAPTDDDGGQ